MKKINNNTVFYIYLSVIYVFSLWLSIWIISDLKIVFLLIVSLIFILTSIGYLTYIILFNPTLYQEKDCLKIKRPLRTNLGIKLSEIISLEKVGFPFGLSPMHGVAFIKYKIVIRENSIEKSFLFYDTLANSKNISEFAGQIKKETPFFRNDL